MKYSDYPRTREIQENLLRDLFNLQTSNSRDNAVALMRSTSRAFSQGIGLSLEQIEEILDEVYGVQV